jgi:Secretion system C-terminal sorting domain
MRVNRSVYTILLAMGYICSSFAQDTLFFENFDSSPGTKPFGWTTELEEGDSKWQFVDGGGTKTPSIPGSRRPATAYSPEVNALYFFESLEGNEVVLVSPPINLEYGIRPEIRFRHVQMEGNLGFGSAHDELRIYYKTHFDSAWTELRKLAEYTDEVADWTEQVVLLPEEAFVPECYFSFRAKTNYGWGVGIDDVAVIETEIQARQVKSISIFQDEADILPSGSKNNPILRIDVSVEGNTGSLALNSLDLTSLNTSDTDIDPNGVKLHCNYNNRNFYEATILESASFVAGEATFNSLDLDLPTGHTNLWISYDISENAARLNVADAMIAAGSINIGGSTFPSADVSPAGSRTLEETVFYDDFASDLGWALEGDFQRGRPRGLGGLNLGNPDPLYAAGDTMVLGNDLSGLGAIPGDYEPLVPKYGNLASSPVFDLFYYNQVKLNFLRWLNVTNNDTVSIEMSLDGGSNWSEVWANHNNLFTDGAWKFVSLDLSAGNRQSQAQLRFNLGPTTLTDHLSGWNLDNFAITGNYVEYDVGPVALLSPGGGCGHSEAETVSIRLENFGPGATPGNIPLRYSFDGGDTFTDDILSESIAFEGQWDFSFADAVDLSTPGVYHVVIETALGVDEEETNNQLDTILYVDPVYSLPYIQDFENGTDFWRTEGSNSTFELGVPLGAVIHTSSSGVNAWVSNLDGVYADNEDSYLLGPCFDFTGIDYPVFECQLYLNTHSGADGLNLEYSLDKGQTWSRVGNLGDGAAYDWNWYNSETISALVGGHGWTSPSKPWHTARILLDTTVFRNSPAVKFRFHFASDASGRFEGVGIDDIRIYEAPRDIGVLSVESPIDGCAQDIGDHVAVTVVNYGLDTLMAGDTILVGYAIESEPRVIESFILSENLMKGASMPYVFKKALAVFSAGLINIEAFTLLPDDIDFYNEGVSNDTTVKSFDVAETPYVFLPAEIYTVRPDTLVLDAYTGDPANTYLWQDASTNAEFKVSAIADGIYHVTASNAYCDYRDTTYVYRLIADLGVTEIIAPVSACELSATVRPSVELRNFGTDTLHVGDQIPVRYQIDSDAVIEELAVIAAQVLPDSSFEYTFVTASDMSEVKSYSISSYSELDYDNDNTNDDMQVLVEVYGYTPIDLGVDTVIRAFDYILDAGAGFDSYLWQDGSDLQTLLIDTTGLYSVMVQEGSMCANSDTLLVTMLIPDIGIKRLSNPTDGCGYSSAEHVEFYIFNLGTDSLYVNDTVFISYQLNGGDMQNESFRINRLVEPGDSIYFASLGTLDLSGIGSYQFSVTASYTTDLIPGNNNLNQTIEVFLAPTVSLGADRVVNTTPYTLDAGSGFVSYLWQDGSTSQQFLVDFGDQSPDSTYAVIVTDINGCSASDEVKISFDLWDVGVSSILSPLSACILTDQEELRLFVKNFGTHPIVNEMISVIFSVNGENPVTGMYTISEVLIPGDSLELLLGTNFDFSRVGDHSISAHTEYAKDLSPSNDAINQIIRHIGNPEPELGGVDDTLSTNLPLTLDAGAEYMSYLWNGVSGEQTYVATEYGWYKLEVMSIEGCSGQDSVFLGSLTGIYDHRLPGEFKVYPVPADQFLHIDYRYTEAETLYLDIYDTGGRKIHQKQFSNVMEISETLDVNRMAPGMYYLRLRSDKRQLQRQIVIHKH